MKNRHFVFTLVAISLLVAGPTVSAVVLPTQQLWGALSSADDGIFPETVGGAEVVSSEALPGNPNARSSATLTANLGLPELKIFAEGASGENARAEGIQKYRYDGASAGDVLVNASFSASVEFTAQYEATVALFTEDGIFFNTESELASLFNSGVLRFNFGETIGAEDLNLGSSSSTGTLDLGIEANLEPGTVFWVYSFFGGTAFEGTVDGFSTGTLSFADPSGITLLGGSVPEPGSLVLVLLGSIAVVRQRK